LPERKLFDLYGHKLTLTIIYMLLFYFLDAQDVLSAFSFPCTDRTIQKVLYLSSRCCTEHKSEIPSKI